MNIRNSLKLTAVAAVLVGSMGMVQAAACLNTDIVFGINYPAPPTFNANQCFNDDSTNGGNDSATSINALPWNPIYGTDPFVLADKTDAVGTPFDGYTFTLSTGTQIGDTYEYTVGLVGSPLPAVFDLVFAIKGGGAGYAAYLFDNLTMDTSGGGLFTITFLNGGGNVPDLSHGSLYVREGSSDTTSQTTSLTVVEPGSSSLALLGLGLLGVGFLQRRKSLGR